MVGNLFYGELYFTAYQPYSTVNFSLTKKIICMRISLLFQIKTVYKVGTMGKVYIQMVDLVANALLTLLEQNQCRRISFQKLDEYGAKVIEVFTKNGQTEACLIMSREDQDALFDDYSDFFEEVETDKGISIALKEGKTVSDLVEKFRTYLALDLMMAFMNTETVRVLHKANG